MKYYQKRSIMIRIVVTGIFLILCFALIVTLSVRPNDIFGFIYFKVFCSIVLMILLFAEFRGVKSLINPRLVLEITNDGFYTENYSFIKWENVTKLYMTSVQLSDYIVFEVKDYKTIRSKMSFLSKIVTFMDGSRCSFSLTGTGADINEVYKIMKSNVNI